MILTGGTVYTLDPALPRVAALAVTRDGRVARGVEAWEGDASQVSAERVDLGGRTVLPGLVDAHVHFRSWALDQLLLDLSEARSVAECAALVAERAAGADGWIVGRGFREELLADAPPTAAALDAACPGRPVALWSYDRHTLWLSTAAMAATGAGAALVRETDAAVPLPQPGPGEALAAVAIAQRAAHGRGVTAVHDFEGSAGFGIWQDLHADRRLTLRVLASQRADRLHALRAVELRGGFGDDLLRLGPVKVFADGALSSRTARMLEPYASGGDGVSVTGPAELEDLIAEAAAGGLAVAVHAIGDRANREVLDAFEQTAPFWHDRGLRQRIEHAQHVHPDDVARFGRLGVIASMQPVHALHDGELADRLLGERAAQAHPWLSLESAGARLAFGSDAPIEPLDPLAGIAAAVQRTWHPEQALDVSAAVAATTTGAAFAAGWEQRCGRLGPGYAADLVVLDDDPFTCPTERLAAIGVVATMVGGRWVHGRPPW
jgi:predicted amidohydrolase YtcJ